MSTYGNFLNENQDAKCVEKLLSEVKALLLANEEVEYIAIQKKPLLYTSRSCVAITNKRVIFCRPKNFGRRMEFKDHQWEDIIDIRIKENMLGANFSIKTANGSDLLDYLPKAQARKLYQLGRTREKEARNQRRQHALEVKRAAAGSSLIVPTTVTPPPPASHEDTPEEKLKKLKAMLDYKLLSQAEYDERRTAILACL